MRLTYQNPVWHGYLADPFILRWHGEYYAYGTGQPSADGLYDNVFPVLHSTDFVTWEYVGQALTPPQAHHALPISAWWAPEVVADHGRFYMYYSAADGPGDESHRLHVAIADHPAGPFQDSGHLLLPEEGFTIDAHPFHDPRDGHWYLFFAKDFFDARVGTGIAVVRLAEDMVHTTGPVSQALRPTADWHIFARNRPLYGAIWDAWHTVEGPCVVEHDGLYYCFYSGGAWETPAYGVSYGVASHVFGPYRDEWSMEGPAVLRGIPGMVLGPGHNSLVLGPDGQTHFIVYHAWDAAKTARRMCIDPLVWTAEGPRCAGPTIEPQEVKA